MGKHADQQIIICSMESKTSFVEEWDYDFSLFKHQCQEKRPVVKLANDNDAKRKFVEGVQQLKTMVIQEKAKKALEDSKKDEELQIKKQVDNTQSMTFLAMQKENREKEDENSLDTQLEQEEKKKKPSSSPLKKK